MQDNLHTSYPRFHNRATIYIDHGEESPLPPGHELEPKNYKSPYTCSGCRMQGFGKRHACDYCDYILHDDCMFPAPCPIRHPFFCRFTFEFLHQPAESPGCSDPFCRKCSSGRLTYCDACGKPIYGFNYHCREKGWDLHPCCSKLKEQLLVDGVKFQLREKVSLTCWWCNKRWLQDSVSGIRGWSYVSRCSNYHFHVYCVSEMVVESWRRSSEAGGDRRGVDDDDDYALAIERIDLSSVLSVRDGGRGRSLGNKYWRMVRIFLKAILGILFGDPSTILASFLADLITQ